MPPANRRWTLTRRAVRDLEEIWRFTFEKWSVAQADAYHNDIIGMVNHLASGRLRGRRIAVSGRAYQVCAIGSHNIFFREERLRIVIVRILHNRMDLSRHL